MATRTSTQSGNFNSTSTWGGSAVPVDGDQFVVAAGHIVTVNDDRRTTNGYHDSTVNGKLHITGTGQLRMNGNLKVQSTGTSDYFTENNSNTGAYYLMDHGAKLEIKGTNSDAHHLSVESNKYNWLEVNGTNPNVTTTLSSNAALASTSLSVASGTGFASGDWINAFRPFENIDDWEIDRYQDEGMVVHDVSGNTIYPRWFVSPNTTITRVNSNKLFVADASVFRKGQKIIFGTGSNRNIKTISSIGKNANRLVLDSAVTGSVVGETVYRTGTEMFHESGACTIQKIATALTADSNTGSNTITVASTGGLAVGQKILIEANCKTDYGYDYEMCYEISAISGNTITLTANLENDRETGAWVTIFSRDTKICSTDYGNEDQRPFIWCKRWTSSDAYFRRIRFRNCMFDGIGANTTNTTWYRGVGWNGLASYENTSHGQYASGMEGCTYRPNYYLRSCMYMRDMHQVTQRNCVSYYGDYNFWRYAGGNNFNMNNNISWRAYYTTFLQDGAYEPRMHIGYNHFSRSDDYGCLWYHHRNSAGQVRHNYWTHHEQRPTYVFYQGHNIIWENNYWNFYRSWPYIGSGGDMIHLNSYFGNDWDATTGNTTPVPGVQLVQLGDLRPDRMGHAQAMYSINHNWKEGATAQWTSYMWREWDDNENAWKVFRDTATNNAAGQTESIYVPAGATVHLAGEIKLSSGFSGQFPSLYCRHVNGRFDNGAYFDGSTTSAQRSETSPHSYTIGHQESVAFTSAAIGAYERKTLTISPVNYDYYLAVSIFSSSANAADNLEHWHQKPLELYIDSGSGIKEKKFLTQHQVRRGFNNSSTRRVKRLGGRIK
tara:strand:- start:357 stop:2849 length:2493 start_codon:yes stop_codon:yes gene_type:complete